MESIESLKKQLINKVIMMERSILKLPETGSAPDKSSDLAPKRPRKSQTRQALREFKQKPRTE